MYADEALTTPVVANSDPVSFASGIDTYQRQMHGYAFPDLLLTRDNGYAPYTNTVYIKFFTQGCYPKISVAKVRTVLCGNEEVNKIINPPDQIILNTTARPNAPPYEKTHRIFYDDIYNVTMQGDTSLPELDCVFKRLWLSLDEQCEKDLPTYGSLTQIQRYTPVIDR